MVGLYLLFTVPSFLNPKYCIRLTDHPQIFGVGIAKLMKVNLRTVVVNARISSCFGSAILLCGNRISKPLSLFVFLRYVAVGNEPFLNGYNGRYVDATLPALKNIQTALAAAGLVDTVKAVVPCNADILGNQALPSQHTFRADLAPLMLQILAALDSTKSPFVVNLYPFLSLVLTTGFPIDFAFFSGYNTPIIDGTRTYSNVFDASYDGLVSALASAGYPNMAISVGEIGWPTDGAGFANITLAQKFNQQLVNHLENGAGTPLRPGKLDAYVFGLLDENAKSTLPGNFERHWGVFNFDGSVKYPLDLTGIPKISPTGKVFLEFESACLGYWRVPLQWFFC